MKTQLEQLLKEKQDKGLSDDKIKILMAEITEKIDSVNEAIGKINQESNTLNNKLIVLQEQERQLNITIKEFKELESNYTSDISRLLLSLIAKSTFPCTRKIQDAHSSMGR